ncbi:hypothetical protein AB0K35_28440 [Micromonospora sp. NPDC053740]|uniref:hypothetical protein n=1 Tax=Micromonospora sp. NPDC053740 TaxID=3155173 RepID=UPI003420748A
MGAAVMQQLAMAVLWSLAGVAGTLTVQIARRERAEKAEDDARVEAEFGPTLARWSSASDAATRTAPRRPRFADRFLAGWAALTAPAPAAAPAGVEPSAPGVLDPERTVDDIFAQAVRGFAPVNRPFDEQIRDRNDVLHGRFRAAADVEDTTLLPGPVVSAADGAR